jgi:glycosyltransferase involved in cell wall biosynthesis
VAFLLIGRMLRDKGVGEYVEAARQIRLERDDVRLRMLGFVDVDNRTAIPRSTIEKWHADGDIEFLGSPADVRPHIAACDCVVLPSYREGTAVSLLEAASMAKPIVASDVPGCREVVEDGLNGFLCAPRDVESLAATIARMADLGHARRVEMGSAGRAKILREYDEKLVVRRYLRAIADA